MSDGGAISAIEILPGSTRPITINGYSSNPIIAKATESPFVTPALFDSHTHGGAGVSVTDDPNQLLQILEHGKRHGTNRMILSLVSSSLDQIESVLKAASGISESEGLLGVHLEGPFIATERCGAHDKSQLRDLTDTELGRILEFPGLRSITVAAERVSLKQVERLSEAGVVVALGHTNASYETAMEYFAAGASVLTHAFNAMPQIESRAPGPVIAALESGAWIEVIADGAHVAPALVTQLASWAGEKLILVTDSMAAAGSSDGEYQLGDVAVMVQNSIARRIDNGALAGSTLTLDRAVRNLISWGVEPYDAISAATRNPTACYGIDPQEISSQSAQTAIFWDRDFNLIR